ncbi:MAG: DciA family protein [Woeseiaceae bacterium]|nr:DciA family protein [Woeseiaceae bacterium]
MTAKSLESLLNPGSDGDLGGIVRKARTLADLTTGLKSALADDLASGIIAVNLREDALVLVCSSSAWASRLRFEEQQVREAAASIGQAVEHVVVRVSRDA